MSDNVFMEDDGHCGKKNTVDAVSPLSPDSSLGGLEVFAEEEDEDMIRDQEQSIKSNGTPTDQQQQLGVTNGYGRSISVSPKPNYSTTPNEEGQQERGSSSLQRRESKLKKIKRRLSESFVRREPTSRPNSLDTSTPPYKNGGIVNKRNSISTSTPTDTIGPTLTTNKPINAFDQYTSKTLPARRYSTTAAPLGLAFGRLETYKKLEPLGEGSYATVYKGTSTITGQIVALKEIRLNSEEGTPFTAIREASLLKGLKHSNIVTLHDIIHTPKNLTFVFEYVDTDLSRYMEKHPGPMDARNVKVLMVQLLRGLTYCHRRKILHRDLKPQNLLLNHNGELKLADFGLARAKSVPTKTYSNEVVTLWYRPPDVLLGSTEYSTPLDMWGVGCIFVEMLTGKPLFPGLKGVNDQLNRIWMVLGTPSEKSWPGVSKLPEYHPENYETYQCAGLESFSPLLDPTTKAGDLAKKLLRLIPKQRHLAEDALAHEYFSSLPPAVFTLPDCASVFLLPGVLFYR